MWLKRLKSLWILSAELVKPENISLIQTHPPDTPVVRTLLRNRKMAQIIDLEEFLSDIPVIEKQYEHNASQ